MNTLPVDPLHVARSEDRKLALTAASGYILSVLAVEVNATASEVRLAPFSECFTNPSCLYLTLSETHAPEARVCETIVETTCPNERLER
jgi:hypothetical protein